MLYINIFSIIYEHKPQTDNTADRLGGSVCPQILVTGTLSVNYSEGKGRTNCNSFELKKQWEMIKERVHDGAMRKKDAEKKGVGERGDIGKRKRDGGSYHLEVTRVLVCTPPPPPPP